jgi:hypothetical protein
VAGVSGVLDDAAGLPQAPFRIDVPNRWEHGAVLYNRVVLVKVTHHMLHCVVV